MSRFCVSWWQVDVYLKWNRSTQYPWTERWSNCDGRSKQFSSKESERHGEGRCVSLQPMDGKFFPPASLSLFLSLSFPSFLLASLLTSKSLIHYMFHSVCERTAFQNKIKFQERKWMEDGKDQFWGKWNWNTHVCTCWIHGSFMLVVILIFFFEVLVNMRTNGERGRMDWWHRKNS